MVMNGDDDDDDAGWVGLADREKLSLKPTLFADNRLIFLEPVEGVSDVFKTVQSGKYDVKVRDPIHNHFSCAPKNHLSFRG